MVILSYSLLKEEHFLFVEKQVSFTCSYKGRINTKNDHMASVIVLIRKYRS